MEFFIIANSFAAPFFSDTSNTFQEADSAEQALDIFAKNYKHPCGLYAASCYKDANAYHKGEKPLAKWLSNEANFMIDKTGAIYKSGFKGKIRINGAWYSIDNPKEGSVVTMNESGG